MNISHEDVIRLAELARLELTSEEAAALESDLTAMLDYVDKLSEVDCDGVEPTTHAVPLAMRLRADEVAPPLSRDDALRNAPDAEDGMFRVPRVVND
jgi:aspartyl-tRNA(Asn)/glutamyl-tRNA(Gln) amidotransferase subunit C